MLLTLHIVFASAWIGLVAGEAVIELTAKDRSTLEFVAKAHKLMDVYIEGPLVFLTLITGSFLLYNVWPNVTILSIVKITCGLAAIITNVLCIRWVVMRANAGNESDFKKWAEKVNYTKYAIPLALAALVIGIFNSLE
jgi:hypothetical protein